MKRLEDIFKLELIDSFPSVENLNIDKAMAFFGNSTYKKKLSYDLDDEAVLKIHRESTRRGHATITSLPELLIHFKGTRILDYYLTSFKFTRALISSTRRINYNYDDFALPDSIINSKYSNDVEYLLKQSYDFYQEMLKQNVERDQARKILPLCFLSQGFVKIPLDLAIELTRTRSKVMELSLVGNSLDNILREISPIIYENKKKLNFSTIYSARNIFQEDNFILNYDDFTKVNDFLISSDVRNFLKEYKINQNYDYHYLSEQLHSKVYVQFSKYISLAIYNEEKRHSTVDFSVESIYDALNYALYKIDSLEKVVYLPKILEKKQLAGDFLKINKQMLLLYENLIKEIPQEDAIYIVPQSLKIHINGTLDAYNLFHPFGYLAVRSCITSDLEMYETTNQLIEQINELLPELKPYVGQKCKIGFCPEKNYCSNIFKYNSSYNQEIHKKYLL
ncbi:MAG: FAD-dependent thymidylate synthase [Candidatus Woesearchaeota archaeon]